MLLATEAAAQDSEIALIHGLRKRDERALASAYDRYARVVYSVLVRITGDPFLAEDLLQEVFFRTWTHACFFNPKRGSLGVWILSIARNMAIDYKRSAAGKSTSILRPLEHCDFLCSANYSNTRNFETAGLLVRRAFLQLTFNQRQALELAYFEGFSQSEIAERLHQPLGTVKSWMRSGLSSMRRQLTVL